MNDYIERINNFDLNKTDVIQAEEHIEVVQLIDKEIDVQGTGLNVDTEVGETSTEDGVIARDINPYVQPMNVIVRKYRLKK